jgi:transcriptional regulator with XRE-family HTH domain
MIITSSPRRRLLGDALRRYRENLGYRLDEAASILECDRSKISRIETGQRGIRAKELRELLTEYGVGGSLAILRFPGAPSLGVVQLAGPSGGISLHSQTDVAHYAAVFAS